ncbi:MAG: AAA-like domain-containing protein, partial [Cyanobacteria bacterium P01_G01_bin.39]
SSRKQGSIIIVFNEIEKIFKNLEFKEELFELILQIYKQRQNRDIFKKINFLFVGSDNYILQKISIGWIVDFSQKEGEVTINKIECDNRLNKIDLNKIIIKVWKLSDGNPYLTQELFQYILTDTINIVRGREIEYVNNLLERIR